MICFARFQVFKRVIMVNSVRRLEIIRMHLCGARDVKSLSMVQQRTMSTEKGSQKPFPDGATQFLETIFSSPDTSVLSLEAKCKRFCDHYSALSGEEKLTFVKILSQQYGVNQDNVIHVSRSVVNAQEKGEAALLMVEERLRNALIPPYQQLFSKIGRIEGGVKFLVDMRADVLTHMRGLTNEKEVARLRSLQLSIRDMLTLWFSVGFLSLQRITWESPCDMVQKVSDYEAVHPIRNWTDLKRRVGPYRRCFVFTHGSMPREPVVVLHTALTNQISNSIHSILKTPSFSPVKKEGDVPVEVDIDTLKEDPSNINSAIFYSITSTQKGLQGVDLGNYLIKTVVKELRGEFPHLQQFSSLSPIPGFRDWLITEINQSLHAQSIGEQKEIKVLLDREMEELRNIVEPENADMMEVFKTLIQSHSWVQNEHVCSVLQGPLMRLCGRYLYLEKRRGYALNPVANFHLGNGAVLWRTNWMADMTMRGITQSCGIMVNYRYFLENTEENSRKYLEEHFINASPEFLEVAMCIKKGAEN